MLVQQNFIFFVNYVTLISFKNKIIKKMKNANDKNFLNFVGSLDKELYCNQTILQFLAWEKFPHQFVL